MESKKLLSTAGKLKLLSSADKAGFNLARVSERTQMLRLQQYVSHVHRSLVEKAAGFGYFCY